MVVIATKRCACRWVLQHQHKLKHSARSCYLKVKHALGVEETRPEFDTEYSFKYSNLNVTACEPDQLRAKPEVSELKFGHVFTDHMFKVAFHKQLGGWQKPSITPFESIELHPAAKALHYAVELFEGTKAYRGVDDKIRVFRPELNMNRMNLTAMRAGLPTFDGHELIKCMSRLITMDAEWVPHSKSASLYIRPTLIGTDGTLGVGPSESALLFTIMCPVGPYFKDGQAVSLYADPTYVRAWPGGCGDRKLGANYGPTIAIQQKAQERGRHQVLWLYGEDHQITELGMTNIFILYVDDLGEKVLVTPPLNGLILPGITRQSVLELAKDWNEFKVEERKVTMMDLVRWEERGRLLEIFGTGTAANITPVDSIEYLDKLIRVPTIEHDFPIHKRLKECLEAIQYGYVKHPWAINVEDCFNQ